MKKHIPNIITLGNVFCGCLGLVFAFEGNYEAVAICVVVALICDFLDGFVARALGVSSPIGKDLDSLADMVTFGVLPSIVMFQLMKQLNCTTGVCTGLLSPDYYSYTAFLIALASALRLAKFNNDTRQSDKFIGLPTPANCAFLISLPLIYSIYPDFVLFTQPRVLLGVVFLFSYLLLAELPLIALKFKDFSFSGNFIRYLLILISIVLVVIFKIIAIPIIVVVYITLSIIDNLLSRRQ